MTLKTFTEALQEALTEQAISTIPTSDEIEKGKTPKLKYKDVAALVKSDKVKSVTDLSTGKKITDLDALSTTIAGLSKVPTAKVYWSYDTKTKEVYIGVTESISKQYKIVVK